MDWRRAPDAETLAELLARPTDDVQNGTIVRVRELKNAGPLDRTDILVFKRGEPQEPFNEKNNRQHCYPVLGGFWFRVRDVP